MKMNYEELKTANATPAAASMVETFRAMGYSLETAMADILDNSISLIPQHYNLTLFISS